MTNCQTHQRRSLRTLFQNYRIASLDIKIVDPQVLYVETQTMIYYDDTKTKKDNSGIIASAKEALVRYSEMIDVARFGGTIRYSRIVGVIDDSDFSIVRNVSSLRMRKNLVATIDTAATYEICFENPVKVDYDNPVLYSTGFKMVMMKKYTTSRTSHPALVRQLVSYKDSTLIH